MNINKKISIRLALVIIIVCGLAVIVISSFTVSKCGYSPNARNPNLLSFNSESVELSGCYFEWQCQLIDNGYARNFCYADIAGKKNNKKTCENIDNESIRNACLEKIEIE